MTDFSIHVRTLTGLEGLLAEELATLGARKIEPKSRLVICEGDRRLLYQFNLQCRMAIRVLLPLTTFPAETEKALYAGVREIDWSKWMRAKGTLAVNANVHSSFSTHSLFLAQLVKDAVVDQFREKTGERPSVDLDSPDLRIVLSLYRNTAQVYVDSSGESLHHRGYRRKTGEAPLNETLAAGLIRLSGWDGKRPFLDPMCGSGTLPIEAGLIAKNIAPGLLRKRYGFQGWPDYDRKLYQLLIEQLKRAVAAESAVTIWGLEKDPELVKHARENVERAGLSKVVRIECGDFFTWNRIPEKPGLLLANPPYDERLRVDNVQELWQRIGERLKQAYRGWSAALLCGNALAAKFIGLRTKKRIALFNGAIECRLFQYELPMEGVGASVLEAPARAVERVEIFANRLRKNAKHFAKKARREKTSSYRVYDWDIPELPFIVDREGDRVQFVEIPRNYEHSPLEQASYMKLILSRTAEILQVPLENIQHRKEGPGRGLNGDAAKAKRVRDDRDGAEAHGGAGKHGA